MWGRDIQGAIRQQVFHIGHFGLFVMHDVLDGWRRGRRLAAIFGQGFAGQQDWLVDRVMRGRRRTETRALAPWFAAARAATGWSAARLISARLVTTRLITTIVAAFGLKISRLKSARVTARLALRRSVFRWRKITTRSGVLRRSIARPVSWPVCWTGAAAATASPATTAPASTAPAISTTFATLIRTSIRTPCSLSTTATAIIAAAKVLSAAFAATARRIILRRIVVRRKILRR